MIVRLLNSMWETLDVEFVLGSEARNGTFRKVAQNSEEECAGNGQYAQADGE